MRRDEYRLDWKQLKKQVFKRYGRKCYMCRTFPADTLDHYLPAALGGKTTVDNLRPACRPCNQWKRDMHPREAKRLIKRGMGSPRSIARYQSLAS